jgi:5-methylcytosine-specific restriction endonuclease McrA
MGKLKPSPSQAPAELQPDGQPNASRKSALQSSSASAKSTTKTTAPAGAVLGKACAELFPLIRKLLWAPDGKAPPAWDERREASVLKRLLVHRSISQVEVAIRGLAELRDSGQIAWLKAGQKVTCRALYNSRAGATQMFELATAKYWSIAKRRPRVPLESIGSIMFHMLRQSSEYKAYLRSDAWRVRRERALEVAGRRCQRCPACTDLQVHHLRYTNLGNELDEDLEVLCSRCHKAADAERAGLTTGENP